SIAGGKGGVRSGMRPDFSRRSSTTMKNLEVAASIASVLGGLLWVYGYFVVGHPSLLDWSSFSPVWVSSFIPHFEADIGMVVSVTGMIVAYGAKWLEQVTGN